MTNAALEEIDWFTARNTGIIIDVLHDPLQRMRATRALEFPASRSTTELLPHDVSLGVLDVSEQSIRILDRTQELLSVLLPLRLLARGFNSAVGFFAHYS